MLGAIKYALRNLTDFTGRDARQTFWYWVLAVYLVMTALSALVTVPAMVEAVMIGIRQGQSGADPATIDASIRSGMTDMVGNSAWAGAAGSAAMMVLLAGSFVRRLHDSDKPGWIALVPAVLTLIGLARMPTMIAEMTAAMQANPAMPGSPMMMYPGGPGSALLALAPTVIVIVLGALPSTNGPNRYGEAPVRF